MKCLTKHGISGLILLNSLMAYGSDCLEIYEGAIQYTQAKIDDYSLARDLKETSVGFTKEIWKEAPPWALVYAPLSPIYAPLLSTISFFTNDRPIRKNNKTYRMLVPVLKGDADDNATKKLKKRLKAKKMSNEEFVGVIMDLSNRSKLCRLKSPIISLSEKGMEAIQAKGYTSAMHAMGAAFSDDIGEQLWWDRFESDYSNFERTYYGPLSTKELRKLFKEI